jgi:two-component system chemotaxis response regulator CheY
MKAIVLDDSKTMRTIIAKILNEIGFEVFQAINGREALNRMREIEGIDLALVDWNMPEMDGIEFIQAVRAEKEWDRIRIMMVTAETERDQVKRALAVGADEYVTKPFTKDALIEKLQILGAPSRT